MKVFFFFFLLFMKLCIFSHDFLFTNIEATLQTLFLLLRVIHYTFIFKDKSLVEIYSQIMRSMFFNMKNNHDKGCDFGQNDWTFYNKKERIYSQIVTQQLKFAKKQKKKKRYFKSRRFYMNVNVY